MGRRKISGKLQDDKIEKFGPVDLQYQPYQPGKEEPANPEKGNSIPIIRRDPPRIDPTIESFQGAIYRGMGLNVQDRQTIYELYRKTLLFDPHAKALYERRLGWNTGHQFQLQLNGEVYPTGDFFRSPKWKEFVKDIISTKFWGFSMFEFNKTNWKGQTLFDYFRFPNHHVNPYAQEILSDPNDFKGVPVKNRTDYLQIGNPDDMGLLAQLTILSIYRRLNTVYRNQYAQLASTNFNLEVVPDYDRGGLQPDSQAEWLGRSSGGVMSQNQHQRFETLNQASSQQNDLFQQYNEDLKNEMAIFVLGQTMTTSDGSSRSQAEVHQEEQDSIFLSDREYLLDVLNYEWIDYLKIWFPNLPKGEVKVIIQQQDDRMINKKLQQFKLLADLGWQFTTEEIKKHFGEIL
jgi:hypothetical protein